MTKIILIFIFNFSILFSQQQTGDNDSELPSSTKEIEKFTPEQDSAFKRAMRNHLPNEILIKDALNILEFNMEMNRLMRDSPWLVARRNLASIPNEFFEPRKEDIVHRQQMIQDAQYVPYVQTLPRGFGISAEEVGKFLGIVEDTNPTVNYTLNNSYEVEIVVYSINAKVIATIFKGVQTPGRYQRTWNGRNDNGKPMPTGDYIIEVRIGDFKYIRKYVEWFD